MTGRPRTWKDKEALQNKIDEYFKKEVGVVAKRGINDEIIMNNNGKPQTVFKPPTVSGLALYLGFVSRQSIYDYIDRNDEFSYIIKKAVGRIEQFAEERLFGSQSTGAIFWLKCSGWNDKPHDKTKEATESIAESLKQLVSNPKERTDD